MPPRTRSTARREANRHKHKSPSLGPVRCPQMRRPSLKLDTGVKLQRLAATTGINLSEVSVADRRVLNVRSDSVERVSPGHTELQERPFILLVDQESLAHTKGFSKLRRTADV